MPTFLTSFDVAFGLRASGRDRACGTSAKQCCDCGLVHRLDFRIVGGRIEFRTRRDDRATAAARRALRLRRRPKMRGRHVRVL